MKFFLKLVNDKSIVFRIFSKQRTVFSLIQTIKLFWFLTRFKFAVSFSFSSIKCNLYATTFLIFKSSSFFFKKNEKVLHFNAIFIQTIEIIHDFDHCEARYFWIRAYRVNVIRAIIIIDRHCNQKELFKNKKMIKTIHNKKIMINV